SARWQVLARVAAGLGLAVAGIVLMLTVNLDFGEAWESLLVLGIVITGLTLLFAPWVWRLISDLSEERRRRIRSEERAEVAAHLHDSVLQTLALIQRNPNDSQTMMSLARRQERELRDWLYGDRNTATSDRRFRRAIETIAAEVEDLHRVPVEVVVVGDRPVDESLEAVLASMREALINAARHSGADHIDVYAESRDDMIEIFVRDKGSGFDPASVPDDRRGLSESIVARTERAGGTAVVETAGGEGTEVALTLRTELDSEPVT
ncbi:MAG: ATP-binding protein, partial [Acidimicrobiia bacterium]|nr:ATP-binding protein [Acidimicrobiia bacterium]